MSDRLPSAAFFVREALLRSDHPADIDKARVRTLARATAQQYGIRLTVSNSAYDKALRDLTYECRGSLTKANVRAAQARWLKSWHAAKCSDWLTQHYGSNAQPQNSSATEHPVESGTEMPLQALRAARTLLHHCQGDTGRATFFVNLIKELRQ